MTDITCPRCGRLLRRVPVADWQYPSDFAERLWCDTCYIFIDESMAKDTDEKTDVHPD